VITRLDCKDDVGTVRGPRLNPLGLDDGAVIIVTIQSTKYYICIVSNAYQQVKMSVLLFVRKRMTFFFLFLKAVARRLLAHILQIEE
jgi:hypothetical protein